MTITAKRLVFLLVILLFIIGTFCGFVSVYFIGGGPYLPGEIKSTANIIPGTESPTIEWRKAYPRKVWGSIYPDALHKSVFGDQDISVVFTHQVYNFYYGRSSLFEEKLYVVSYDTGEIISSRSGSNLDVPKGNPEKPIYAYYRQDRLYDTYLFTKVPSQLKEGEISAESIKTLPIYWELPLKDFTSETNKYPGDHRYEIDSSEQIVSNYFVYAFSAYEYNTKKTDVTIYFFNIDTKSLAWKLKIEGHRSVNSDEMLLTRLLIHKKDDSLYLLNTYGLLMKLSLKGK
jgi:hypothetical protein